MALDCYHSDGITGYSFSHEGYWTGGYVLNQHKDNANECADECDNAKNCIAFYYRHGDNKQCVGYHSLGSETMQPGLSRAYVKCGGMYKKLSHLITFRSNLQFN